MAQPPRPKAQPEPPAKADPEQYRRFLDAARELGCDDSEEAFERTFARVVPARRPGVAPATQTEARARAKAPKRVPKGE